MAKKTLKEWEAYPADKFANWLIEHHGAHESSRRTIELNIQTQYDRCSLEGQLLQATERPQVTVSFSLFGKKS